MEWLRQWFRRPTPSRAASARLQVEQLEARDVPSASPFVDLSGARFDFIVDSNHNLLRRDQTGQETRLGSNVLNAHAYRDAAGQLAFDVVFTNNQYFQISNAGSRFITGDILAASTTLDTSGQPVIDVVFTNNNAFRFSSAGMRFLSNDALFVSNYRDATGFVGIDFVTRNNTAYEFDSTGSKKVGDDISSLQRFTDTASTGAQAAIRLVIASVVTTDHDLFEFDSTGRGGRLRGDVD